MGFRAGILDSFCSDLQQGWLGASAVTVRMQPTEAARSIIQGEDSIILACGLWWPTSHSSRLGQVHSGARCMSIAVSGNLAPGSSLLRMLWFPLSASITQLCRLCLYRHTFSQTCPLLCPGATAPALAQACIISHKSSCLL